MSIICVFECLHTAAAKFNTEIPKIMLLIQKNTGSKLFLQIALTNLNLSRSMKIRKSTNEPGCLAQCRIATDGRRSLF